MQFPTTKCLIASKLPWSKKLFTALPGCCPLRTGRHFLMLCACVPVISFLNQRPVIDLGAKLVHTWNCSLAASMRLARSLPVLLVVAKAYAIGPASCKKWKLYLPANKFCVYNLQLGMIKRPTRTSAATIPPPAKNESCIYQLISFMYTTYSCRWWIVQPGPAQHPPLTL